MYYSKNVKVLVKMFLVNSLSCKDFKITKFFLNIIFFPQDPEVSYNFWRAQDASFMSSLLELQMTSWTERRVGMTPTVNL